MAGLALTFGGGVHYLPYERSCPKVDYEAGAAASADPGTVTCRSCRKRLAREGATPSRL